ncbi:Bleomycin hydrolase [Ancistrocladus abbreviatus]
MVQVDRRYSHYCEQMQMVVNSFDLVMGFGSAMPYTAMAQRAMSRHFRCLKDAIQAQLKHSCELLGEKETAGSSGLTKGETPRLKMLEQSLRHQRAFHQMGLMDQEAWRPQRGLPERSVNILRAWLFEHFLHPYPSDADKHLLARQTGLSRNQVPLSLARPLILYANTAEKCGKKVHLFKRSLVIN